MRIIPVTLVPLRFTRATDIIRQYPRSLVRFAHSPARSFHSHRLSLILLAMPLTHGDIRNLCRITITNPAMNFVVHFLVKMSDPCD